MNNILPVYKQFVNADGVELLVDTTQGLGYATLAGLERIFEGKTSGRTIARRLESFKRAADYGVINAETLTAAGLRSVAAHPAAVVFELALEFDKALAKRMGAAGANVYLLGMAGYKVAIETPKTFSQALRIAAELQEQIENQASKILEQAEVIDELYDYSSIIRISKLNGHQESDYQWRRLKNASELSNKEIKKAPCPRYGTKNLYHHSAWSLAYPEAYLPQAA